MVPWWLFVLSTYLNIFSFTIPIAVGVLQGQSLEVDSNLHRHLNQDSQQELLAASALSHHICYSLKWCKLLDPSTRVQLRIWREVFLLQQIYKKVPDFKVCAWQMLSLTGSMRRLQTAGRRPVVGLTRNDFIWPPSSYNYPTWRSMSRSDWWSTGVNILQWNWKIKIGVLSRK